METFSCSSSAYTSKELGGVRFNFSNCFKLGENKDSDIVAAIIEGIQLMLSIPKFLPYQVCFCVWIILDKMYLLNFSFYFLKYYKSI